MIYTTQLIMELINTVNEAEDIDNFCIAIKGFDDDTIVRPISQAYLSFTCNEEKVTYLADDDSEYCQTISLDINVNAFIPLSFSVLTARSSIEVVMNYLTDCYADQLTSYTIGETDFDDEINAYCINSHLYFDFNICAGETSDSTQLSGASGFFCQTHVNDTDLHLTDDLRSQITNPFVVGSYVGTGFSVYNTTILGFKPRLLLIFADSVPLCNITDSRIDSYAAMATQVGTSQGITLNATGFSVRQNIGNATDPAIALINEENVTYNYIAFI